MANAGTIVVGLIARTEKFTKGMRRATSEIKKMAKESANAREFSGKLAMFYTGGFVRAIGTAAIAIGGMTQRLADLADQAAITADETIKFAERIGIPVQELQSLQYAASQTGVRLSAMNMGLQRMTRRVAEAAQGVGEAKQAIIDLGLDAKRLVTSGPYQSFLMISDALSKIENNSEQVRLAFKLFDSEGVSLVNTLRDGPDAIIKMRKEAEKLGAVMSESVARSIADTKTEIDKYTAATQGFEQTRAAAFQGSNPLRQMSQLWKTSGPTRKFYDFITKDPDAEWKSAMKTADARRDQATAMAELAKQTEAAAKASKNLAASEKMSKQEDAMKHFNDMLSVLKDRADGIDDLTIKLNQMDAQVGLTREQYTKMKGVIDEIIALRETLNQQDIADRLSNKEQKTESFRPGAREIDSSRISVAGLAMSARDVSLTDVNKTLQSIDRNTRITAQKESLN